MKPVHKIMIAAAVAPVVLFASKVMAQNSETVPSAGTGVSQDGWTYVIERDTQSRLIQVRVVVRSGRLSDPAQRAGLAHFTARAMLRGTKTRPFKDLTDSIERLGATLQVDTDENVTIFHGAVLAKNFDAFLDILRDVLTQPAFDVQELRLLQSIIQGELRTDLQEPRQLAAKALLKKAFEGTPLAVPAKGTVESVSSIRPEEAEEFFRRHFVRENLLIGVTAPLTREDVLSRLQVKLEPVPRGELDAPVLAPVAFRGRHAVIVDRKGMSTVPVFMATPGFASDDPRLIELEIGNFVFGADFTSRLTRVLRMENGWTYGAYSGFEQVLAMKRQPGLFSLYTFPAAEFAAQAIPRAMELLDEYTREGISSEEFSQAVDALRLGYAFRVDTAEKRLERKLRAVFAGRPYLTPAEYGQIISGVTLDSVNDAIRRKHPTADMLIAVVGDPAVLKPILSELPFVESVQVIGIQP